MKNTNKQTGEKIATILPNLDKTQNFTHHMHKCHRVCLITHLARPWDYAPYPSLPAPEHLHTLRPLLSPISGLSVFFFVFSCIVSIVRYGVRLKNPGKATGPDSIPLKVIKFASNVIEDYNIVIL